MTICILSIDIGRINTAIGFGEFVPNEPLRVLSLELFSPKPSKGVSWGEACNRLASVLHERLTTHASESERLYTVVERQISKSRANCHLALIAQSAVTMWSLTKNRPQDTFRYLWAPEKFVDPVPAYVRTHAHWKQHGIFTVAKFIQDHAPMYDDIKELVFTQHAEKPDDLCDCFLQMIAIHRRLGNNTLPSTVAAESEPKSEPESDSGSDEEEETRTPKPKPKPKPKKTAVGPIADLSAYA